jgi:RimJ/RimL family protein N-acetyltransferase
VSLSEEFLEATVLGNARRASAELQCQVPSAWMEEALLASVRLEELRADPLLRPWLNRAVILRATSEMVGHVGFHARPSSLPVESPSPIPSPSPLPLPPVPALELGYEIYEPHRRQGYALEAVTALLSWAHHCQGHSAFLAAIAPSNLPSLALARKLGFVPVGRRTRDSTIEEELLELRLPAGPTTWELQSV